MSPTPSEVTGPRDTADIVVRRPTLPFPELPWLFRDDRRWEVSFIRIPKVTRGRLFGRQQDPSGDDLDEKVRLLDIIDPETLLGLTDKQVKHLVRFAAKKQCLIGFGDEVSEVTMSELMFKPPFDHEHGAATAVTAGDTEYMPPKVTSLRILLRKEEIDKMTMLTVIVIWLYLWYDYAGIWRLLHLDPRSILFDLSRTKLMGFFPPILWTKYLEDCQNNIFDSAVITTDRGLRLVTRVLTNRAYEYGREDITTEAIQDKLEFLFSTLPRVHEENLPFYGVRCGLVFGALAAHESSIRDRRSRKFRLGTAAVTGASSTAANIPSINGVPVGKIIEPVATGIRGTLVESFSRRQKRLGRGVTHVEYKFLTQVMEEANDGLVASYNGSAPRDKEGNPLPAFTGQGIVKFKEAAWKAFKLVMNDETCEMGIDLPPEVLKVAPEREAAARISPLVDDDSPPPTPPPKVSPRISTDTNPQKMGLADVMPRRPLRTVTM